MLKCLQQRHCKVILSGNKIASARTYSLNCSLLHKTVHEPAGITTPESVSRSTARSRRLPQLSWSPPYDDPSERSPPSLKSSPHSINYILTISPPEPESPKTEEPSSSNYLNPESNPKPYNGATPPTDPDPTRSSSTSGKQTPNAGARSDANVSRARQMHPDRANVSRERRSRS